MGPTEWEPPKLPLCTSCMNPACLPHWKEWRSVREIQMWPNFECFMRLVLRLFFSGAWSHIRSSLNEAEIFLLTKCLTEGSPVLLWGVQQVAGSVCDLLWGGAQMEQSFWIVPHSISRVAHQVNCREHPLHRDNVGWVGVKYPVILLLQLAKGGKGLPSSMPLNSVLGAWRPYVFFLEFPSCNVMGHSILPLCVWCWGTAVQLQFNFIFVL